MRMASKVTRPVQPAPMHKQLWGSGELPNQDELAAKVLSPGVSAASYDTANEKYLDALLQQYVTYVEMADNISARRGLANTFFLTLNTAVITTITVFSTHQLHRVGWGLLIPLVVIIGQSTVSRSAPMIGPWPWSAGRESTASSHSSTSPEGCPLCSTTCPRTRLRRPFNRSRSIPLGT